MSASWSKRLLFVAALWMAAAVPLSVLAQSSAVPVAAVGPMVGADGKPLAFDIASIRRNVSGTGSCGPPMTQATADGFHMTNCPLILALITAYVPTNGNELEFFALMNSRIVGAPDWLMSDRYDIDARIGESDHAAWQQPATQKAMLRTMMQTLLAERCKLAVHRETKDKPIYALVAEKSGPKFKAAESTVPAAILAKHPKAVQVPGGGGMIGPGETRGSVELYGAPMGTLALVLSQPAERPVVDKTGLTGKYDVKLEMMQQGPPAADGTLDPGPSIFTVVQEQLGLKLEPAKDEVETLVIDHIERPSEN